MWTQTRKDYWDNGNTKTAASNKSPYGYGSRDNFEDSNWQITNTLNYSFDLNKKHNFTVLVGQETSHWESMKLENEYRSFPDGNFGLNDVSIATPTSGNHPNLRSASCLYSAVSPTASKENTF